MIFGQHGGLDGNLGAVRIEGGMDVVVGRSHMAQVGQQGHLTGSPVDNPEPILKIVCHGPTSIW